MYIALLVLCISFFVVIPCLLAVYFANWSFSTTEKDIIVGGVYRQKGGNPFETTRLRITGAARSTENVLWIEGEYLFRIGDRIVTAPTSMKAETLVLVYELDQ